MKREVNNENWQILGLLPERDRQALQEEWE